MPDDLPLDPLTNPHGKTPADTRDQTPSNAEPVSGNGGPGASDPKEIYDIAPVDLPARPPIVQPTIPSSKKPGIDKEGLLTGFAKDTDFEIDPDVQNAARSERGSRMNSAQRSTGTAPRPSTRSPAKPGSKSNAATALEGEETAETSGEFFVEPGLGSTKVWLIIGGVLLVSAVVAAAVNQREHPVLASLLVLYNGFLHTGTGVAAVGVGAVVAGKRLGPLDLTAGRMFAAVAGMLLLANCNINLVGSTRIEELTLGAIVYVAVVAGTFRFWGQLLATVVSAHFLFWLVIQAGMEITAAIGRAAVPTTTH